MKKKIFALLLCVLLLGAHAQAEAIQPPMLYEQLINPQTVLLPMEYFALKGKAALQLLAMGETEGAMQTFGFAFEVESGQTEETFLAFVKEMTMLDALTLQTDVALCWMDEWGVWHLGIPLVEPISWDVEALVLDSRDMNIFCGYSLSTWGALEEVSMTYLDAYWNGEYIPATPLLLADE